ncbi:class E sortase [Streptomyces antimicrobicus]|uniref:Class E sortase n=1 Tax=Streptomyces antimicrobicus TaxID=2883108 RepID=A0ABS8B4W9_9ACTN|nr:class E sortase [Streptomyces antimicrobicus]MCB5179647.1 class E sortase [Streptomyces antimicrobicus]
MRDHIRVVVQGSRQQARRVRLARALWVCAEVITTVGVVVALLVVHQVWWTNRQAVAGAQALVRGLEGEWGQRGDPAVPDPNPPAAPDPTADGDPAAGGGQPGDGSGSATEPVPEGPTAPAPGAPRPGTGAGGGTGPRQDQAYAVLRIPRLGVVAPVAEGVSRRGVLDKGYVGHYPGTAQPGAQGNVALAGHRNTHGEPFRYINRLRGGDEVHLDVRGKRFTYVVDTVLPETTARDSGVIAPVPRSVVRPEYGYGEPGAYLTLTTCTPEYSSKYRLIVWAKLRR